MNMLLFDQFLASLLFVFFVYNSVFEEDCIIMFKQYQQYITCVYICGYVNDNYTV